MDTINGIPAHPLFVHFVVIAVPVTALVAIAIAVWPRARKTLNAFPPILALVALIAVPITTSAGESLEKSLPETPQLQHHAELGDELILAVGPLFGVMALLYLLQLPIVTSRLPLSSSALKWLDLGVRVATVTAAIAALIMVILVGDSGAKSVWGG